MEQRLEAYEPADGWWDLPLTHAPVIGLHGMPGGQCSQPVVTWDGVSCWMQLQPSHTDPDAQSIDFWHWQTVKKKDNVSYI